MDVQILFKDHCGDDVQFISCERVFRELKISYRIPKFDAERVFLIRVTPGNGLHHSIRNAVLRAADSARNHAYRASGRMQDDLKNLLQGKLVDEHPRSDAQAAEVGATVAVDPKP